MTAIAAISDGTTVWLGGDSAAVSNSDLTITTHPKVWQQGPYLFGLSGSPRAAQILRYAFEAPTPSTGADLVAFMATTFVDALRDCFKTAGYAKKDSEREGFGDSRFFACTRGRVFKVWQNYQVDERTDGIDAIGCAEDYVLGSLHTTASLGWDPPKRLLAALEAAERFSTGVAGPFTIISSKEAR